MSAPEVAEAVKDMMAARDKGQERLDRIQRYLRDDPQTMLPGLPTDAPEDVKRLARFARVNLLKYLVSARVQNMYVEGFQTPDSPDDLDVWEVWQANRMDSRQIGVHRAALSFGTSYVTVLPGTTSPVIRGYSPREMTAWFDPDADDDSWPALALQCISPGVYRLYDNQAVYRVTVGDDSGDGSVSFVRADEHGVTWQGVPVCPVVRFRDTEDLDDGGRGIVEPYFPLQDQVNITTFGLLVAQHYGAFRQRYVIGWLAESEEELVKASAARLQTFEDPPGDVQVGEFQQTDLRGYIESREASIRHLATVSQTPVHELLGQFVNLSAEALEAARASSSAAVEENRIVAGESWEQVLGLASELIDVEIYTDASVIWRDTRIRSLQEAVAAWSQAITGMGIPQEETWDHLPGIPQHEVARWKAKAEENNMMAGLGTPAMGAEPPPPPVAPAAPPAMMGGRGGQYAG